MRTTTTQPKHMPLRTMATVVTTCPTLGEPSKSSLKASFKSSGSSPFNASVLQSLETSRRGWQVGFVQIIGLFPLLHTVATAVAVAVNILVQAVLIGPIPPCDESYDGIGD